MTNRTRQDLTDPAIAVAAKQIYQDKIRPLMTEDDIGKFVIVDVNSGEYEIDEAAAEASHRLRQRCPDSLRFGMRVGYSAAYFFGWHEEPKL